MIDDDEPLDRRLSLLCDRALVGLDPDEAEELDRLLAADGASDALDLAAAAIDLGVVDEALEPMPASLRAKIEASASLVAMGGGVTTGDPRRAPHVDPGPAQVIPLAPRRDRFRYAGWIAAAACLALSGWALLRQAGPPPLATLPTPPPLLSAPPLPVEPARPRSPAEEREALLGRASDVVRVAWSATKDPAGKGATGDVVWSQAEQRGYMRFHGLGPNDPRRTQFQLWIFDQGRDDRYPVDGGVFDVDAATGDVIVPITAKLRVDRAALFAVTVEAPGGVVVSKREHIVLTAAVPS
jgi:hypothetical protein